jgi:hypothetical protein
MKNSLIAVFVLILNSGFAQLDFKIENIFVSKVIEEKGEEVFYHEHFAEGTGLTIYFYFVNNSRDTIILYPSTAELDVLFSYENSKYYSKPFVSPFDYEDFKYKDTFVILPGQRFGFQFFCLYLLGKDFYKWSNVPLGNLVRVDNTKEVIATLPTLKVRYKDKNIEIITSEIENVTVGEIPYIYDYIEDNSPPSNGYNPANNTVKSKKRVRKKSEL